MRALALIAAVLALALVAGCGGDDELAPQTPGEPASMPIPEAAEPPGGTTEDETATEDDPATPEDESATTPEAEAPTDDATAEPPADQTGATEAPPETATAPEDTGGGTTAPPTEADGPTNDTAPPAGSDAEQFEDFCAQNPGAC
jgi:hypothetical protein